MSKNNQDNQFTKNGSFSAREERDLESKKEIKLNVFYFVHDGSRTGHPGLVIWKNDKANRYLVIRFDSDKKGQPTKSQKGVRHITKLSKPIDENVLNSYVHNRPMICKRKDIGKELFGLIICKKDHQIIEKIRYKEVEKSPSVRKK